MIEVKKMIDELSTVVGVLGCGIVSKDGRAVEMRFPGDARTETISIMAATVFGAAGTLHTEARRDTPSNIAIRGDECETLIYQCGKRALVIVIVCPECDMAKVHDLILRLGQEFSSIS